ncbi:MAG: hypothetical protein LQ338_000549 [Usnochroma carphineum]|nr:MAG: hypothetical protein LQ338_000549 [Usnochroma carphineum]
MPRQLPLTPPEYYEAYSDSNVGAVYQPSQCAGQPNPSTMYGGYGLDQYSLAKQSAYTLAPLTRTASGKENERWMSGGLRASANRMPCMMNSTNVPRLPPIKVPEQSSRETRQVQSRPGFPAPPASPIKEEKATGGVAAHLDYEMDTMADFVAELARGMYDLYESRICLADIDMLRSVYPKDSGAPGASAFRKYVGQILSSTRLPSSTILLGLFYLATRMKLLSSSGKYPSPHQGGGQIYRMLTTALLLGSKFLDDNTFQNRSWSEVSNIPVSELNVLEIEWLLAIKWDLHVDPEDTQGFTYWRMYWQTWQSRRFEKSLEALKLTPLDVNVRRLQTAPKTPYSALSVHSTENVRPGYSNPGFAGYNTSPWQTTPYDRWPSVQSKTEYSPPSAPGTGPTTPEWYDSSVEYEYALSSQPSSASTMQSASQYSFPSFQQTAYPTPCQPYISRKWNGHLVTCDCMSCIPSPYRHLVGSGYRLQSVFG